MKPLIVYLNENQNNYDIENLIAIFVLKSQLSFAKNKDEFWMAIDTGTRGLWIKEQLDPSNLTLTMSIFEASHEALTTKVTACDDPHLFKRKLKKDLYQLLETLYEPMSKWGILVGIRPVKIVHELMDQGVSSENIRVQLEEEYLIFPEKVDLLLEIAIKERPYLYPIEQDKISIYICIPFCPTRCLYCSFPSNSLEKKGKLVPLYLEKLIEEIKVTFEKIHNNHQIIDCIYIGGGTPTSLNHQEMALLLRTIEECTDLTLIKEFTVEAGRPDTIDESKLQILKDYGVDRICINPQTMNDETLKKIGRNHLSEDIVKVMAIAKTVGFKNINMDLILGLPDESLKASEETIKKVIALDPENVTVHTLAVKRASRLNENIESYELTHDETVEQMMMSMDHMLRLNHWTPYYMYRQKKMIGHLENVGYSKTGYESLYNMRIMEERHTIIALGAGAVSKICYPNENRFERVANFKGVEDYINRFDEVLIKRRTDY